MASVSLAAHEYEDEYGSQDEEDYQGGGGGGYEDDLSDDDRGGGAAGKRSLDAASMPTELRGLRACMVGE